MTSCTLLLKYRLSDKSSLSSPGTHCRGVSIQWLIRADLPVSVIAFLTSALKIGIISTPEIFGLEQTPSLEQLTETISDLIRRWLEPERPPSDSAVGKQAVVEWLEKVKSVEEHLQ